MRPAFFRHFLNRTAGAILFVGVLPLMVAIAILVWLDDGRPILFTQLRAGQNGTCFQIIKFRTLTTDATGTNQPSQHTTRIGDFLRRWALDELPQLWNVLRGDMNLVGPRPVLPAEARGYDAASRIRLHVRPGLTGWAQVHGRNRLDWAERMELDLWYVRNRTLTIDLWILVMTPFRLFSGQEVYGPGNDDPSSEEVRTHLSKEKERP